MNKLVKFLWAIRYVIVALTSVLGVIIVFNLARMFLGEEVNIFLFILTVLGFGLNVALFAIVDFLHSNSSSKGFLTNESIKTLDDLFKSQFEAFSREYSNQRGTDQTESVDAEFIEQDEFEGDPVYDNLDNIYAHARHSVVRTNRDHAIDDLATLTVLELKTLCRENGISGFSRMKKHELVRALEELDKEKSSL